MKNRIASLDNGCCRSASGPTWLQLALRPHSIVNATGSTLLLPPIEGLRENIDVENGKIFSITGMIDNLRNLPISAQRIVGAGAVGLDVIEYFYRSRRTGGANRDAGRRRSRSDIITKMPC
ncbi:hypothetical protein MJ563_04700 [Klebsiella pneumoniae]|nr:hypothetical protein MJ563_04700 [Klebsiella pneumoniae]